MVMQCNLEIKWKKSPKTTTKSRRKESIYLYRFCCRDDTVGGLREMCCNFELEIRESAFIEFCDKFPLEIWVMSLSTHKNEINDIELNGIRMYVKSKSKLADPSHHFLTRSLDARATNALSSVKSEKLREMANRTKALNSPMWISWFGCTQSRTSSIN